MGTASQASMNCASAGMAVPEVCNAIKTLFKTRMCKFRAKGACTKGNSCTFAHEECDLSSNPGFHRTSVCPVLISTGECKEPDCKFAHSIEDLRIAYKAQGSSTQFGVLKSSPGFSRSTTPSTEAEDSDYQDASDGEESFTCSTFSRLYSERGAS